MPTGPGGGKRVYFLSIEFLVGKLLFDALINLRQLDTARDALHGLGVDLDQLRGLEPDAALGNGGLGRLAACCMDSAAVLALPACGYGIRYEHGLFMQQIRDGWQRELPERWLAFGNPWEFARFDTEYSVRFGGSVEYIGGAGGTYPVATDIVLRASAIALWCNTARLAWCENDVLLSAMPSVSA